MIKSFFTTCSLLISIAVLSACAPSPLTMQDAQASSNLTPLKFAQTKLSGTPTGNGAIVKVSFNEVNPSYLTKPANDMTLFCKATGGNPVRYVAYQGQPINAQFRDPERAGQQAFESNLNNGFSPLAAGAGAAAVQRMLEASNYRNRLELQALARVVNRANENGFFGAYECRGVSVPWTYAVFPIRHIPPVDSSNLLTTHAMEIQVAVKPLPK